MRNVVITGSCGLIGSEAVLHFADKAESIHGIDCNMRKYFFGDSASTAHMQDYLESNCRNYVHHSLDIRSDEVGDVFQELGEEVDLIVHAAAQPSHDWAAREPLTDFSVNAMGTIKLLELTRQHCPEAVFVFLSTNKVYGDLPNRLPLVEAETRWTVAEDHSFCNGIDESMPIDQCLHSVFGASKVAADVMVQEYGRYFGLRTTCLRGGCLTGPRHAGAELHGFLAYLMKCCVTGTRYRIFGYQGKQVRDNIHASDLVSAIEHIAENPRCGEVYNMGGGPFSNCSMQEAVTMCEELAGKKMETEYVDQARKGDHIWYISDLAKFKSHYPAWEQKYSIREILEEMRAALSDA